MSDRTARRLSRILAMLPWVIANPGATVDEVCRRFDYTRKTLVEDLDLVFVCGLPGYGPGELMVAFVDEDEVVVDMADYFASPLRLGPTEALSLVASALTLQAAGDGSTALTTAVEKLLAVLMGENADVIAITVSADQAMLAQLRAAIADRSVLELTYTSIGKAETTTRLVEPWQVATSRGQWYLDGHCRRSDAERRFRIDRIRSIRATDEHFTPPVTLPDPAVSYVQGDDDILAKIELLPEAWWVGDYYPVALVEEDASRKVVQMAAPTADVIARLLLRLGPSARLIDGPDVRAALAGLRTSVLARYS